MAYVPHNAYGPWLRYQSWDPQSQAWTGSVLVVSLGPSPPRLAVRHAGASLAPQPLCLDTFQNFSFWRWQLDLQLQSEESTVEYDVAAEWTPGQGYEKRHRFTLPGANQCWHWGFHSCNGFSHGVEASWLAAATALWQDVLGVHAQRPIHCMVGGGDQLYQDGFFQEPAFVEWLKIKDRNARERAPVSASMDAQLNHFMFHHYCNWFSKDHVGEAFASIPNVMTWDDHDLMDGYGSYPEQLQNSPVFQHAYAVGRRFYLLFQQHTSLPHAHLQANMFGRGETYSLIRLLGHGLALVAPDVRSERTRKQVVSPGSWQLIFDRISALPSTVKHLIMLTTIPVVYPKIPLTEKAMNLMSAVGREAAVDTILSKTGLWGAVRGKVVSGFNEPELLDDLLDHWTSDYHVKEREMLIRKLQDFAVGRNLRVTFISGDVHVGGLGQLYSHPKLEQRNDFRYMPQVISSAIMNAPPPAGVVSTLHTCSNAHMSGVDKHTKEKMVRLFKADYPKTDKLVARRNWATLCELPQGSAGPLVRMSPKKSTQMQPGDLLVTLRVEPDHKQPHLPVQQYQIPVPALTPAPGASYGAPPQAGGYGLTPPMPAAPYAPQPAVGQYGAQSPSYAPGPAGAYGPAAPGTPPQPAYGSPAQGYQGYGGAAPAYHQPLQGPTSYGLQQQPSYGSQPLQTQQSYSSQPLQMQPSYSSQSPQAHHNYGPQQQQIQPAATYGGQQSYQAMNAQGSYPLGASAAANSAAGGYGGYGTDQSGHLAQQFSGMSMSQGPQQPPAPGSFHQAAPPAAYSQQNTGNYYPAPPVAGATSAHPAQQPQPQQQQQWQGGQQWQGTQQHY